MNKSTPTENNQSQFDCLITQSYIDYHDQILNYIRFRISDVEDAADIAQDAFVRLLDYKQMLRSETVKSFIFTIVRNLVIDYIRRQYRKQEVSANMFEFSREFADNFESKIHADDLLKLESTLLMTMPLRRKEIYSLIRFEDKTADEVAVELKISKRTVESHLFLSRKTVREFIKQCV